MRSTRAISWHHQTRNEAPRRNKLPCIFVLLLNLEHSRLLAHVFQIWWCNTTAMPHAVQIASNKLHQMSQWSNNILGNRLVHTILNSSVDDNTQIKGTVICSQIKPVPFHCSCFYKKSKFMSCDSSILYSDRVVRENIAALLANAVIILSIGAPEIWLKIFSVTPSR